MFTTLYAPLAVTIVASWLLRRRLNSIISQVKKVLNIAVGAPALVADTLRLYFYLLSARAYII